MDVEWRRGRTYKVDLGALSFVCSSGVSFTRWNGKVYLIETIIKPDFSGCLQRSLGAVISGKGRNLCVTDESRVVEWKHGRVKDRERSQSAPRVSGGTFCRVGGEWSHILNERCVYKGEGAQDYRVHHVGGRASCARGFSS